MNEDENGRLVSLAEAKNILKKVEKDRKELIYEQRIALDHAQKFSVLPVKKINEIISDLQKIELIKEAQAFKIADILPTTEDDVKAIFAKERITPSEGDIKQILKIIEKHYIK